MPFGKPKALSVLVVQSASPLRAVQATCTTPGGGSLGFRRLAIWHTPCTWRKQ